MSDMLSDTPPAMRVLRHTLLSTPLDATPPFCHAAYDAADYAYASLLLVDYAFHADADDAAMSCRCLMIR